MRVFEIKIAGSTGKHGLRGIAVVKRPAKSETIRVDIELADGSKHHEVMADSMEDVWSMAECLQFHLEGNKGTNSDVRGYFHILEMFMD